MSLQSRTRRWRAPAAGAARRDPAVEKARRKFLRFFPGGYADETYIDWERDYKWQAHLRWEQALGREAFAALLERRRYADIAAQAVAIESRTNLLFSFEKMALRDAVRPPEGAKRFATALFDFLHGGRPEQEAFEHWVEEVGQLPRRQTRVLTWPVVTVFGFIAQPKRHVFLKPRVTQEAARKYGAEFIYRSRPNWESYASLLAFARRVMRDTRDLGPRDFIDAQSFIWVQGSEEY